MNKVEIYVRDDNALPLAGPDLPISVVEAGFEQDERVVVLATRQRPSYVKHFPLRA